MDKAESPFLEFNTHSEEQPARFYTAGDRIKSWDRIGAFCGAVWTLLLAPAVFLLPGIGLVAKAHGVLAASKALRAA